MQQHKGTRQRRMVLVSIAAVIVICAVVYGFRARRTTDEKPEQKASGVTAGFSEAMKELFSMPVTVTMEEKQEILVHSSLNSNESYLLARIAMAEAEGEDTEGKALVMLTVLNRVQSDKFPDTIEEVITEENAFTSYSDGRYDRVEPDADCWAALELIQTQNWDKSRGALYFECTTTESTWHKRNLEELFVHGNHTFYKERE